MGPLANLGINLGYLIMQVLAITCLTLILWAALYKPIMKALDARKERIAKGLEDARQAAVARDNAEAEAKRILDDARAEAAKMRSEAVSSAEVTANDIRANANDEARGILAKAREDAVVERNGILADMRSQIASISIAAANKVVESSIGEQQQRTLINDFFSKVPAAARSLSGSTATITSAVPLTDSERSSLEGTVSAATYNYNVDPSILGGLVVRVDDQLVDDSTLSKMSSMRESMA